MGGKENGRRPRGSFWDPATYVEIVNVRDGESEKIRDETIDFGLGEDIPSWLAKELKTQLSTATIE